PSAVSNGRSRSTSRNSKTCPIDNGILVATKALRSSIEPISAPLRLGYLALRIPARNVPTISKERTTEGPHHIVEDARWAPSALGDEMNFITQRVEYGHHRERAYVEFRGPDEDGGDTIVVALFSYRTTEKLSKKQLHERLYGKLDIY